MDENTTIARSLWGVSRTAAGKLRRTIHALDGLVLPRWRARSHALPDVIVIGAQKCGTTSLYHYLSQHPAVFRPKRKEVHYFDSNYHRDIAWYKLHFSHRRDLLHFESTPYYLFHPKVASRVAATLPNAKLIVMLRDPVARAYSHYWHERRLGYEHLSFADAITAEDERLAGESTRLVEDDSYYSSRHQHLSYLARGCYAEQLKQWLKWFPQRQFLFIESERFFEHPGAEMVRVTQFLGLPPLGDIAWMKKNVGTYSQDMEPALRRQLRERFAEVNKDLESLTGTTWRWNR